MYHWILKGFANRRALNPLPSARGDVSETGTGRQTAGWIAPHNLLKGENGQTSKNRLILSKFNPVLTLVLCWVKGREQP